MIPVNIEQKHWVGIKLDFLTKEVKYYDGRGQNAASILYVILAFMMLLQALFLVEKNDENFGRWQYCDVEKSHQPFQDNDDDCGAIYCLIIWRMYLKQDFGTVGHQESKHFRKILLTLMLNIINYCYYDDGSKDLNLFEEFPIIPNLFINEKDLSIEYLCKEVGKSYFKCGYDHDENTIKGMKSLINNDNFLSVIKDPAYRYLKQNIYKKTMYFMENLIRHNTNDAISKFEL